MAIGRRQFISALGGAAVAWPHTVRAQQPGKVSRIGVLGAATSSGFADRVAGLREGLRDRGYVEGTNVIIEFRWAEGNYARLPELVAELIRLNVDVIVTLVTPGTFAAKQATATIPIVIASIGDPVAMGLVASIARPGGNITGESFFSPQMQAKKIELLKETMPHLKRVAVLSNPDKSATRGRNSRRYKLPPSPSRWNCNNSWCGGRTSSRAPSRKWLKDTLKQLRSPTTEISSQHSAIAALTTKWRLLSIGNEELARAGGVIGYGVNYSSMWHQAAVLVDKILKGAKPTDLPIERATRFTMIVNLKAAKAIGIAVPTSILLRADEVIE